MLYFFMYKRIILGGCELLIEKLARQLMKQNNTVGITCCQIDDAMEERYRLAEIKVYKVNKWSKDTTKELNIDSGAEVRFITFFWEDFTIFHNSIENAKTMLYAVNLKALCIGIYEKKEIKNIFKQISKKSIYDLSSRGNIVCIDEETIEYTEDYYLERSLDIEIIRVPEDIQLFDQNVINEKFKHSDFNILTIARAEFPTKGYLFGLIDWFKCDDIPDNVTLTIISYVNGINALSQAINSVPEEKQKKIKLIGKTDFNELQSYFACAKLYVGMGTTILDAAQTGTISIAIKPFTYDLFATGTFEQDYKLICMDKNISCDNQFHKLFKKISAYSENEYFKSAIDSRNVVIDYYSSEKIAALIRKKFDMLLMDEADDIISFFYEYYKQLNESVSACLMMNQWVKIKQMGEDLVAYLKEKGYCEVAIYGMNYVGQSLVRELKGSTINVKYGIDMRADDIYTEIKVIKPSETLDEVDAVLVAAVKFFDEVRENLCKKVKCPIISLESILFDV